MTEYYENYKTAVLAAAETAGVKVKDVDGLLAACSETGLSAFTVSTTDPAVIADRVLLLSVKRRELFESPASPTNPTDAWRKFCGGLDPMSLPADRRGQLWDRFRAEQAKAEAPSAADQIRRELTIRHGADESKWPNLDRARLADASGARAVPAKVTPNAAQLSAINSLQGQAKLEAFRALTECDTLKRKIAAGVPGADLLERRLQHLRHRFPTVLAV